jgi:ATP-binding cassette subfamily B protein
MPEGNLLAALENVSFAFDDALPLLRDLNLFLRQGEIVMLRGISGSGKSSLLCLLAGVLQPASGTICIDRASVAYVSQNVILLDDSIRNNLLFGRNARSDADLYRALAVASLQEFVEAQPLTLDTPVGDNGILISGGQRQRLGLARAILGGANLLLLDEATSALDQETESRVLANLSASGVAVLLVTHRVYALNVADRVIRLEEGRLYEESTKASSETGIDAYIATA